MAISTAAGAPGLPGGPFRSTRPWLKATGEWRAEGSSLDNKILILEAGSDRRALFIWISGMGRVSAKFSGPAPVSS